MLNEDETKELIERLTRAKDEVKALKNKLSSINKHKENWFKKKSDINKEISSKIGDVRGAKHKRNDLTFQVNLYTLSETRPIRVVS